MAAVLPSLDACCYLWRQCFCLRVECCCLWRQCCSVVPAVVVGFVDVVSAFQEGSQDLRERYAWVRHTEAQTDRQTHDGETDRHMRDTDTQTDEHVTETRDACVGCM
eukprot:353581-Rhodomonas_salina.1